MRTLVAGFPVLNSLAASGQYAVNNLNQWEVISYALFDSASYPAAGIGSLQFFQNPVGQGTGFGGGTKTLSDTNMVAAGSLPAMQAFIVTGISVEFFPTRPAVTAQNPAVGAGAEVGPLLVNDVYQFRTSGHLSFNIGSKDYVQEGPLMRFPAATDFEVEGALSDSTTAATAQMTRLAYAKAVGPSFVISPNNILLVPNQNFMVTLGWPEGLQVITNPAHVYVRLEGVLLRASQ